MTRKFYFCSCFPNFLSFGTFNECYLRHGKNNVQKPNLQFCEKQVNISIEFQR